MAPTLSSHNGANTVGHFDNERLRGMVTSVVSGGSAGLLNLAGVSLLGWSVPLSAFVSTYVAGNIIAYVLDIMFAKESFSIGDRVVRVSYTEFYVRAAWLFRSLVQPTFLRFIISIIIDTLIGITILRAVTKFFDDVGFLSKFSYRDVVASGLIALLTFVMFTNMLRFDWAYKEGPKDATLNAVVMAWAGITMMLFAMEYLSSRKHKNRDEVVQEEMTENEKN